MSIYPFCSDKEGLSHHYNYRSWHEHRFPYYRFLFFWLLLVSYQLILSIFQGNTSQRWNIEFWSNNYSNYFHLCLPLASLSFTIRGKPSLWTNPAILHQKHQQIYAISGRYVQSSNYYPLIYSNSDNICILRLSL